MKNTSNTGGEQLFSSSFKRDFFVFLAPENLFFARENESKPASKDQSEQHTVFTLVKAEMRQTFYRHTRRVEESKVMPKKKSRRFFVLTYLMPLLHLDVQK